MSEAQQGLSVAKGAIPLAENVVKRQKLCSARTSTAIDSLIKTIEDAKFLVSQAPLGDPGSCKGLLENLSKHVDGLKVVEQITNDTKELHGAVGKLGKAIDRDFTLDVCKAVRGAPMDPATLNHVVAEHLYQEGAFLVGDTFSQEAQVPNAAQLRAPYESMHAVLEQIRRRNLQPALEWIQQHASKLRGKGGEPTAFEFAVHRLAFLQTLQNQGEPAALEYARAHFPQFAGGHMAQVQRLMGAMCFTRKAANGDIVHDAIGPYNDLFSEELWDTLAKDFVRQSCALLGQAQDSPLLVTVAAGSAALPTLLKLASVVSAQPVGDLAGHADQLPVEIPLGREFVFHSIFACPVSREQSTHDNPPMMLPCGHCMCKQSILKIAKSATRAFKCPYCPVEATLSHCMELHFPDRID